MAGPKLTPGAVLREIPKFVTDQAMGLLRGAFGAPGRGEPAPSQQPTNVQSQIPSPNTAPATPGEVQAIQQKRSFRERWFGPGKPMAPMAPREDVAGRASDYPVGINLSVTPRQYEPASFHMIRGLFEGLDLAKLCVQTRKNQMSKLSWEIVPRMKAGQKVRVQDDPRCAQLEAFFRSPDRIHDWNTWMRQLLHDMLVFDAPAIYVRRTLGGDVYSLEVLDGTTIIPRVDGLGRIPQPPEAAYTQILKGLPAINYTTDELIYFPQNLRPGKLYGWGAIEQIMLTIQIAIRRDIAKLNFWTEGNIPEALIGVPENWTPAQIASMQSIFDSWTSDQAERSKARFIPGGTNFQMTRPPQTLDPQMDEWLARIVCYAYNLPTLPLVNQQNRATSETANDAALREGLGPCIVWLKGLMDHLLGRVFRMPDLEFMMDNYREEDPNAVSTRELAEVARGALSIDEYRAKRGQSPLGMGPAIFGIGPAGVMFIDDLVRAHKQGALAPQMPAPPEIGSAASMPYDQPTPGAHDQPSVGEILPPESKPLFLQSQHVNSAPSQQMPQPRQRDPAHEVVNQEMTHLSPALLEAAGARPDYAAAARPSGGARKPGGVPALVRDILSHHEAQYGKKP